MKPAPPHVLVTDGSYKHTLGAIRSLAQSGFHVEAVTSPHCLSSWSRYLSKATYPQADFTDERFDAFVQCLRENRVDVLLPVGARSVRLVSRRREALPQQVRIAIPGDEAIQLCLDKDATNCFAAGLGLHVPRTWVYHNLDELEANSSATSFPVIIKGISEIDKHPPLYCPNAGQLMDKVAVWRKGLTSASLPFPILQEYVTGAGEGFFALYQNGVCKRVFMHRRIREYPPSGGASCCAESIYEHDLFEAGKKLLDSLAWHGVAMVEFKRDSATGQLFLMEINPKYWGSLDLALACGVPFPALHVRMAMGEEISYSDHYAMGLKYHWPLVGDIQHVVEKPRAFLPVLLDCINPGVRSNIRWDDPLPAFISVGSVCRQLLSRLLNRAGLATLLFRIKTNGFRLAFARGIMELTGVPLQKYGKLSDFLYIGNQHGSLGKYILQKQGIDSLLNLRKEFDDQDHGLALENYCHCPVPEFAAPKLDQLRQGIGFIKSASQRNGKVYLHCSEGVSRAPAMAVAYLIDQGMTLEQAVQHVKKIRPFVHILPVQMEQLQKFESRVNADRRDDPFTP
ncbi:MAG: dual specificity protein phosphatase family protein [bacterium]